MIEILLIWCSLLLITLALLAFRIMRVLKNIHIHIHITLQQSRPIDEGPDNAWRNN